MAHKETVTVCIESMKEPVLPEDKTDRGMRYLVPAIDPKDVVVIDPKGDFVGGPAARNVSLSNNDH